MTDEMRMNKLSIYLVVQGYKSGEKIRSLKFLASHFEIKI